MDMKTSKALVWILTGARRGDNNQMLALAEALGLPFETKTLVYNPLHHLPALRRGLLHVTAATRSQIKPPWPDVVIGVGPNSLPVARYIRSQSGGRTRLVQIGDPRTSIGDLDLLITTPQFRRREAANVLALPLPMGDPAGSVSPTSDEERWLQAWPRPRRLVAVGGSTRKWKIDDRALDEAIGLLNAQSGRDGGSVIAVTSPRTPTSVQRLLDHRLDGANQAVVSNFPRFAALLARCDEVYVTADSVSMLSEAVLTGKPVGMIGISRTVKGKISHAAQRLGLPYRVDLVKFWHFLTANNLVGTVESPVAASTSDTVTMAADAVREILDRPPTTRQR